MKIAIVVRSDLGMRTGKIAVQVGHASVIAYHVASGTHEANQWFNEGQKKIVLKVPDESTLIHIGELATINNLQVSSVRDFGLTQIMPNSLTCIVIGPDQDDKIDAVTYGLKLL